MPSDRRQQESLVSPVLSSVVSSLEYIRRGRHFWSMATFIVSLVTLAGLTSAPTGGTSAEDGIIKSAAEGLKSVTGRYRWIGAMIIQGVFQMTFVIGPEVILLPLVLHYPADLNDYGYSRASRARNHNRGDNRLKVEACAARAHGKAGYAGRGTRADHLFSQSFPNHPACNFGDTYRVGARPSLSYGAPLCSARCPSKPSRMLRHSIPSADTYSCLPAWRLPGLRWQARAWRP